MSTVYIVLGALLLIIAVYFIIRFAFTSNTVASGTSVITAKQQSIPLSKEVQVFTSEELKTNWSTPSSSTITFYIIPQIKDRTSRIGNEYATALNLDNKLKLSILITPDAGRSLDFAPSRLEVAVRGVTERESIDIYDLKMHKWTAVAIVKEGRRFKIYLDGKMVAAHTLVKGMPDYDGTQNLKVGDSRLGGNIALLSIYSSALNSSDLLSKMRSETDNDGKPYAMSGDISSGLLSIIPGFGCPGGLCTEPKKPNPFEQWTSPYA